MKLFLAVLTALLLFNGCSTQRLIERAQKLNTKIVKKGGVLKIDTITKIDTLTTIEFRNDTVFHTSYINTHTTSEGEFRYVTRADKRKEFRLEKRIQSDSSKLVRLQTRLDAKNERVVVRNNTKVERINNRSKWWLWLLIGGVLGFIIDRKLFK